MDEVISDHVAWDDWEEWSKIMQEVMMMMMMMMMMMNGRSGTMSCRGKRESRIMTHLIMSVSVLHGGHDLRHQLVA